MQLSRRLTRRFVIGCACAARDSARIHDRAARGVNRPGPRDQPGQSPSLRRSSMVSTMLSRSTPTSSSTCRFDMVSGGDSTLRWAMDRGGIRWPGRRLRRVNPRWRSPPIDRGLVEAAGLQCGTLHGPILCCFVPHPKTTKVLGVGLFMPPACASPVPSHSSPGDASSTPHRPSRAARWPARWRRSTAPVH